MEYTDFDVQLHELSCISASLNQEFDAYYELLTKINTYQSRRIRPFGLESGDMDAGLEELVDAGKNVISKIKNFIIKLWYGIKNLLDKVMHLFDGTLRKMKGFQEKLKQGLDHTKENEFLETKLTIYPKPTLQKRIEVILHEVGMRWVETDGKIDWAQRGTGLSDIGHSITTDRQGTVKQSYNGAFPKLDMVSGHGYSLADISTLLNNIIEIYEKFPSYKENLIKMKDADIAARYKRSESAEQKRDTILADRTQFIVIQKTITVVLKEMRELGKEICLLCNAIK